MIDQLLTTFSRTDLIESHADLGEKIGDIGLGLLRIGFGKSFTVEKVLNNANKTVFRRKMYSVSVKVAAIAVCILVLPLTILLASIGSIAVACSKSHREIFTLYSLRTAPKQVRFEGIQLDEKRVMQQRAAVPQERKIPSLSVMDTVIFSPGGVRSEHGSGELFSDREIIENLPLIRREEIGSGIYASYTENEKAIIQQQATRGCTAATAAMLIMDNGRTPNLRCLKERNLGTDEDQLRDIQAAGLTGVINQANDLSQLRELIIRNGSAVVSVSEALGAHVIVVDEVSEDLSQIRLRDPYHGWEITVSQGAFLKEWHGGKAIQIET